MTIPSEAIKHLLILGESNSIFTNGWVAGLQQQSDFAITNSSLGSSGIFNAIYKLIQIDENISSYHAILLDTCIQDAHFYSHRITEYFEILDDLIQYLHSHQIAIFYLQFEKIDKEDFEYNFYILLKQFLERRNITVWNVNQLIFKHSDIKEQSELHHAYADPHHIKPEVAFHIGKIISHDIKLKLSDMAYQPVNITPKNLNFGLIDANHLTLPFDYQTGLLHTSLFQSKTLLVRGEVINIPVPTKLLGHEVIGILFNANNANGVLELQSINSLSKNLANNSKLYWQSPLVWSRPLHNSVTLSKVLSICAKTNISQIEQTEYCHPDFIDRNIPICIEIVGLITRIKQTAEENAILPRLNQHHKNEITTLYSKDRFKEVIQLVEKLLLKHQTDNFLWKVYGAALLRIDKVDEAIDALQKSICLCSDDVEAQNTIAVAYQQNRQFKSAEKHFVHAISLSPMYFATNFNLADLYFGMREYDKAIVYFNRALQTKSYFVDALMKRGIALHHRGNFEDAAQDFLRVIDSNPQSHEAHCNLGNALASMGRSEQAEHHYMRAIELDIAFVDAYSNLSHLQSSIGRYEEALESATTALKLTPQHLGALNNLALAQRGMGEFADATLTLRKALEISPHYDEAKVNLAYLLLAQGEFQEGWRLHEFRHSIKKLTRIDSQFALDSPQWKGQSLKKKTLIIFPEQGLGDQIQFIRYINVLLDMDVRKIYLYCIDQLYDLFSQLENERVTLVKETHLIPKCDYHTFLMSLPNLCAARKDSISLHTPYLSADKKLSQQIGARLHEVSGLKVGLCWFGSSQYKYDAERSLDLTTLHSLSTLSGIVFFNLQKGARLPFLNLFQNTAFDFGREIDAEMPPFKETAAQIINLDLVITCDTAVGHLAGALGKPVWLLLPFVADWRWMNEGEKTAWYPHTRLFRQSSNRSWEDVVGRVYSELQEKSNQHALQTRTLKQTSADSLSSTSTIQIPISLGDFFDRISILEIKQQKIYDAKKLKYIDLELSELLACIPTHLSDNQELSSLRIALKEVNEDLWDIEDNLRHIETTQHFDKTFIELARSVYKKNDLRAQIKYTINTLTNSTLREEKSYPTSLPNNTQQSPATR